MQSPNPRQTKLTLGKSLRSPRLREAEASKMLDTKTLFNGTKELKILHNSDTYRLSITKLGKLILTK